MNYTPIIDYIPENRKIEFTLVLLIYTLLNIILGFLISRFKQSLEAKK